MRKPPAKRLYVSAKDPIFRIVVVEVGDMVLSGMNSTQTSGYAS